MRSLAAETAFLALVSAAACGSDTHREAPAAAAPAAPGSDATSNAGPGSLQALADLGLRAVPMPDLHSSDASVREQFASRRATVEVALQQPTARPALAHAYGELGKILHAATAFEGAEASYLNAHQLASDDPRWPYYLGHVYRTKGPLDKAAEWFEKARQRLPNDLAITVWLGDVYLAQGRPDAAEPLFGKALSMSDGSAAAHFGAGRTALARRDYAAAVRHLERTQTLEPAATGVHYPLAMAYRGRGDLAKAEAELAIKGDLEPRPSDPLMQAVDTLLQSAEAYNVRGGAELSAGNWAAAADQFRKGLAIRPTDPSLRHRLGTALAQVGDGPGAVAAWEQVVRTHPEYARAYFSLGVLSADSQRYDIAIPNFETALKNEPGFVQARVQLGWALARSGRPGESLAHFDQALALEPTHAEALSGYGMALIRLGRYKDARDRLSGAAKLYPDQPMITHALARLLSAAPEASVRDGRQAKALVDRLIAKESQSLELGETTAMMLAELGEFAQATSVQRSVIEGAERLKLPTVVARLNANLQRYERREPCRVPFTEDELR